MIAFLAAPSLPCCLASLLSRLVRPLLARPPAEACRHAAVLCSGVALEL